jgi:CheY-like chemotaxis protein
MPHRVGEPQRTGGSERLPTWRIPLTEEPSAQWRRELLGYALQSGIFSRGQIAVEVDALVFQVERSALPVALEQIDQWIGQANGDTSSRASDSSGSGGPSILVVDDQSDIGPLAQDILEPEGYAVIQTTDPMEALRLARNRPFDLFLVDVVMPLMDGRELARRLVEAQPNMKVILMSGYEVTGIKETGWPFLPKPFTIDSLTRLVAATLQTTPESR